MRAKYSWMARVATAWVLAAATGAAAPDASLGDGAAPLVDGGLDRVSAFADEYARALCDGLHGCCDAAAKSFDLSGCRVEAVGEITRTMQTGRRGYDPSSAPSCLDLLRRHSSECRYLGAPTSCSAVFPGRVPVGGACSASIECAQQGADGVVWCRALTCVAAPRGKIGDPCFGTCRVDGVLNTCSGDPSPVRSPTACFVEDGLECTSASQTCEKTHGLVGEGCVSGACIEGAYCEPSTSVCRSPVATGDPCVSSEWCDPIGAFCDLSTGVCTRRKAPLESCVGSELCEPGIACVQGRCPLSLGGLCVAADSGVTGAADGASPPFGAPDASRTSLTDASPADRDSSRSPGSRPPDGGGRRTDASPAGGSRDTAYDGRVSGGCGCRASRAGAPSRFAASPLLLLSIALGRRGRAKRRPGGSMPRSRTSPYTPG